MQEIPATIREKYSKILASVIAGLRETYWNVTTDDNLTRLSYHWKFFALLSRMLLHKLQRGGEAGDRELRE